MRHRPPQDPKDEAPPGPGYPDQAELEAIRRALSWRRRPPRRSKRRWLLALGAALTLGGGLAALGLRGEEKPAVVYGQRWGKPVTITTGGCGVQARRPWLVRHQSADGRWDADGFSQACEEPGCVASPFDRGGAVRDVGATGSALLALISAGNTHHFGPYRKSVKQALEWLSAHQGPDGVFRGESELDAWSGADQAIATFALCRLYASARDPIVKLRARRALEGLHFLAQAKQISRLYQDGQGDGAVAGAWAFLAFRAADRAGIERPEEAFQRAESWFLYPPQSSMGVVLTVESGGQVTSVPLLDSAPGQAPLAKAAGYMARGIRGERSCYAEMRQAYDQLSRLDPKLSETPPEYWLFSDEGLALALGAEAWQARRMKLRQLLLERQAASGCAEGSWDAPAVSAYPGGRIYTTALACLALEVVYGSSSKDLVEKPIIILEEEVEITKDVPKTSCLSCDSSEQVFDSWEARPGFEVFSRRWRENQDPNRPVIRVGLAWLASVQNADGSWGQNENQVEDTGRALLAFLRSGQSHRFGRYKRAVNQGLRWLKTRALESDSLAKEGAEARGMALLALVEAQALTRDFKLRKAARGLLETEKTRGNPSLGAALASWLGGLSGADKSRRSCPDHARPWIGGRTGRDADLQANLGQLDEASWKGLWRADERLRGVLERLDVFAIRDAESWASRVSDHPNPIAHSARILWLLQIPTAYHRSGR